MKRTQQLFGASIAAALAISPASAAELLNISHDGTSADEDNPFDTVVLSNGTDWTYDTDDARSIMTALDNATGGGLAGLREMSLNFFHHAPAFCPLGIKKALENVIKSGPVTRCKKTCLRRRN